MSLYMNATAEWVQPKGAGKVPPGLVPPPMSLAKAAHYADKITEWIAPHCRQIEAVGEVRRRCATCKAIELLVLPRFESNANLLFGFLDEYVQGEAGSHWQHSSGRLDMMGIRPSNYYDTATIWLPKCRLVLHTATVDTWFLRLFETTGSATHVATIVQRVRSLPGTWQPGDLIRVRNKTIRPQSEGHIYDVLNMSLVVPWKRAV